MIKRVYNLFCDTNGCTLEDEVEEIVYCSYYLMKSVMNGTGYVMNNMCAVTVKCQY